MKQYKELADVEELLNPKYSTDEVMSHFVLHNYNSYPPIKFKVME